MTVLATLATLAQTVIDPIDTPSIDWGAVAPAGALIIGALVLLVLDGLSLRRPAPGVYTLFTIFVAGASIVAAVPLWIEVHDVERGPFTAISGALGIDGFSVFFAFVLGVAVILAALMADGYLRRERLQGPELYALLLLSAAGGNVMASANDLIVTFLGLEILSIAVYVLSAMHLRRVRSQEAALKYFVLGAFSSAFFLYGIALVYGATGTTRLSAIASSSGVSGGLGDAVSIGEILGGASTPPLLLAGIALLLVGFGFKVAAVPFHSWTPDVYQGAPSPAVVYMASGVKAAGFAGMLRVLVLAFGPQVDDWRPFVSALAIATLVVGAVLAVVQTDVKRLLAYSSINHAGFILLGVQAASGRGVSSALFYLAAYTFMVAGSFGVVTVISKRGDTGTTLDDIEGLARRQPVLALVFTLFLLAQAGVPLTSGFIAKFQVLAAATDSGSYYLAIVAMVTAVIAAFLYLKIVVAMYRTPDDEDAHAAPAARVQGAVPFAARLGLAVAALATLLFGLLPDLLDRYTTDANGLVADDARTTEAATP